MADYKYGILVEPSSYNISSGANYEMGWLFTTVKEFYFCGFRVKAPTVAEKTCTLWDSSKNAIATATLTSVEGEWVEVLLDEPILFEAETQYTISTWNDNSCYYVSNAASNLTFNTEYLTFNNGKAGYNKGLYPTNYTEATIYPMIDLLLSGTAEPEPGPEPEPEQGYTSIEEIVAGVSNATQLRTNSKQDDGTDTITGVDWFSYGGTVCNSIYASGNSWIGLGSSSEHLKVNRRDAAMWNLWREEGIVKGRRFLRIRWSGYTLYNYTSADCLLTYDVILLETGDIVLYVVDVPTSGYSYTFTLGSLTYTKPTADNRYVTFYLQEDGSYIADYAPIDLSIKKYLVRNESTLYTVADGALVEVSGTLNSDLFTSSGVDDIPDGAFLMTLSAPEVLCWTDGEKVPTLTATVQGVPQGTHEIVSDNAIIGHESIYGITSVEATASDGARFLLSFDGGAWMTYTDGSWSASDTGMTASELVAIPTEAWQSMINSAQTMRLKAIIDGVENVTQVKFNFNNTPPI
jgi:hypothetical protein